MSQPTNFAPVLWSSCLAMLAVGANSTAIMAALPEMRSELVLSPAGVEWAINAYLVVSAAFIVLGGHAADRFGARFASILGLAFFAIASCIIAVSGTQSALLAGRALQGLAAALAVPCTLAAVDTRAAPERRAGAIGAWSGIPHARLQHRPAARRRAHALRRLACHLLAQRPTHGIGHCRPGLRRIGDRTSSCCAQQTHRLAGLRPAGRDDGIPGVRAPCRAACGSGIAGFCRPVRAGSRRGVDAAAR